MKTLAGALVAATLVVAPLVTGAATAAPPKDKVELIGEVGTIEDSTSEANSVRYWEERYAALDAECYKHEPKDRTEHGSVANGGKTVTLSTFKKGWHGTGWVALIVKGGTGNNVVETPKAGVPYASPWTPSGQQSDVSHWIVCKGDVPTPSVTVTPTLEWDLGTCKAEGVIRKSDNVTWTSVKNNDGTTTWTAKPKSGTVFPKDAQVSWTVPNLAKLPANSEACRPDKPKDVVTVTPKEIKTCDAPDVTIETTTTTTPYVWNGNAWVPGTPTSTVETTTRPKTPAEKMECPLPPVKDPEYTAWEDGTWVCGDASVTQTRVATRTTYAYDAQGEVVPTVTKTTETKSRPLTPAEKKECPLPVKDPEYTAWTDGTWVCGETTVEQTRVATTTTYAYDEQGEVVPTVTKTTETKSRPLTPAEKMECPLPEKDPEYTAWVDGEWACGDTTVTQTREATTTTYAYDEQGEVVPTVTKKTETKTRPLESGEIGKVCDLVPGEIEAVCVGDVPFLGYEVDLPAGFNAPSGNPVTITFVNPNAGGEDYVVKEQPLSGALLWPGASNTAPRMWPGWTLVDGEYVKTDGNFDWTRQGVTVRFEVNPTYVTEVAYPEASAECANPPIGGGTPEVPTTTNPPTKPAGTPASADAGALAVTGGGVSPLVVAGGGAALVAGIAVVAFAAYRRRRAGAE